MIDYKFFKNFSKHRQELAELCRCESKKVMTREEALREIVSLTALRDGLLLLEGIDKISEDVGDAIDAIESIYVSMRAMSALGLLDEYKETLFTSGLEV